MKNWYQYVSEDKKTDLENAISKHMFWGEGVIINKDGKLFKTIRAAKQSPIYKEMMNQLGEKYQSVSLQVIGQSNLNIPIGKYEETLKKYGLKDGEWFITYELLS